MMPAGNSPIRPCTDRSGEGEVGADEVNKNTFLQPQAFDQVVNSVAGYRFENGGKEGWNALGSASANGNLKVIRYILTNGDPKKLINLGNRFGCTPLYIAFDQIKEPRLLLKVAKELIKQGADVNLAVSSSGKSFQAGDTPLTVAAEKLKNLELIKFLIQNGASSEVNLSAEARKLVDRAVLQLETNKRPVQPVKLCKEKSTFESYPAKQVLDSLDEKTTPEEFDKKMVEIPEYSLEQGGRLEWNALGKAAANGNVALVRHILTIGDAKKLINLGNYFGCTPLVLSLLHAKNSEQVVKELIRSGANVNMAVSTPFGSDFKQIQRGDTALTIAAEHLKSHKLIKLLLKHGANTSINLSPEARQLVEKAEKEIENDLKKMEKRQMTFQAGARKNPSSTLSLLPGDTRRIIAHMIHKADEEGLEKEI